MVRLVVVAALLLGSAAGVSAWWFLGARRRRCRRRKRRSPRSRRPRPSLLRLQSCRRQSLRRRSVLRRWSRPRPVRHLRPCRRRVDRDGRRGDDPGTFGDRADGVPLRAQSGHRRAGFPHARTAGADAEPGGRVRREGGHAARPPARRRGTRQPRSAPSGDTPDTFYYGHDYRAEDVVRFFALADRDHVALDATRSGCGRSPARSAGPDRRRAVRSSRIPRAGADRRDRCQCARDHSASRAVARRVFQRSGLRRLCTRGSGRTR